MNLKEFLECKHDIDIDSSMTRLTCQKCYQDLNIINYVEKLEAENKKIANEKSILTERLKEAEDLLNHAYDCSFTDSKSQCSCGVIAYLDKYKIEDKHYEII